MTMRSTRKQVWHESGPLAEIQDGDEVDVRFKGRIVASFRVERVGNCSMSGGDVKVTMLAAARPAELRCRVRVSPDREKVFRGVQIERR